MAVSNIARLQQCKLLLIRRRKFDLLFCVPRARPENAPASTHFIRKIPASKHFITNFYQFLPNTKKTEHKLTTVEREQYRRLQNDLIYTCGGPFQEILTNDRNKDTLVSKKLYTRENLSCRSNTELPYYSAGYTNICIFCGGGSLKPLSLLTYRSACLSVHRSR